MFANILLRDISEEYNIFGFFFFFLRFGTKPHLTPNNSYIDIGKVIKEQKKIDNLREVFFLTSLMNIYI